MMGCACGMYTRRMPRLQVYLPDDLYRQVKRRGLSPSELLQAAVRAEIERSKSLAELGRYLAEQEAKVGEPSLSDKAHARHVVRLVKQHARRGAARKAS